MNRRSNMLRMHAGKIHTGMLPNLGTEPSCEKVSTFDYHLAFAASYRVAGTDLNSSTAHLIIGIG